MEIRFETQKPMTTKTLQPMKPLEQENSPKGKQRSKRSEVTTAALESLLDDIYLNDSPAAIVSKYLVIDFEKTCYYFLENK